MIDPPRLDADAAHSLPTPCLLAELTTIDDNIAAAAAMTAAGRPRLRPHFKAHKCTALLSRQVGDPADAAVTCATAHEAEVLAAHGFGDVLVANQVCDATGLAALARAAGRTRVTVAVDHPGQVAALAGLAAREAVGLAVLVEVDVGMGRCGVLSDSAGLIELAEAVQAAPGLSLRGLQCYEGHVMLIGDRDERRAATERAMDHVRAAGERLRAHGLSCPLVSGGGTGTLEFAAELDALDEVQAGSYVLMDATYAGLDLPFANALFLAATVISRPAPDRVILNTGLKSVSVEYGLPRPTIAGAEVRSVSDEHAVLAVPEESTLIPGDLVHLVPPHVDPTMNLHPELWVWDRRGADLQRWAIDGRRRAQTSAATI